MAQKLADLTATVELIGNEAEVEKVYKDLKLTGRNKLNKRSGKRYIEFGEPAFKEVRNEKGTRIGKKLVFEVTREKVFGNTDVDLRKHLVRAVERSGTEVKVEVKNAERTEY